LSELTAFYIDTLDLQAKTSPTAKDHSRQPQHPAPLGVGPAAPHQEASLRQVDNERLSEESHLQNGGWSDANTLREDPGSDDERTVVNSVNGDHDQQRDEQAVRLNGGMSGTGDDADMHDADAEDDMDDDMMDKISSSPSIDDGGYFQPSLPAAWPERSSSLPSTPIQSPASFQSGVDSSPFTTTPIHFPLSVAAARRPYGVPADTAAVIHKSSYRSSPIPFLSQPSSTTQKNMPDHHRGEYAWTSDADIMTKEEIETKPKLEVSPRTGHLLKVEGRLQSMREDSQMSLVSEIDEEEVKAMLQPVQSPTREVSDDPRAGTSQQGDNAEDDDEWTTDSDADSWDEEAGNDDDHDISFSDDPRFVDSGWGGECLRETEDIDFEFVYALHTFVATVEGQANATKGDTMVLLDDSNSYWWLVRVVKDSSIGERAVPGVRDPLIQTLGYLPAEHIETPTERLARLNKHRNIDLSATMLGDTAEKTKNPLKKAMRRRNAKTVQFGLPTYVEASDYDYSSDEDGDEELFGGADPNQTDPQAATEKSEAEQDDGLKVEPLKVKQADKESNSTTDPARNSNDDPNADGEKQRTSDEIFDRPLDPKVSRNGTLRNTDSFFKDDNAETRKITLTPNLLRDDSSTSTTGSRERGPSLESLEKNGFADKVKDDKKKKEKKSGMLSGLFKRKDKKSKGALDSFDSDGGKESEENGRSSPQSKDSNEERPSTEQGPASPQRQASKGKLQKPQRGREESPSKVKGILKADEIEPAPLQISNVKEAPTNKPATPQPSTASTMRLVSPEQDDLTRESTEEDVQPSEGHPQSNMVPASLNPMNMLKSEQSNGEPRPEKVKKAKQRVQLDDFDSENEANPFADPTTAGPTSSHAADTAHVGGLSESHIQASAVEAQASTAQNLETTDQDTDPRQPPGLTADTSSQETPSPVSTPSPDHSPATSGPAKADLPSPTVAKPSSAMPPPSQAAPAPAREAEVSPPVSSASASLPAWSDSSLRTYLDDGSDIRDTLMVINDTTGVVPVGRDHPLMSSLFVEETKTVTQLGGELDLLLQNWLEAKRNKHKASMPIKSR
jgi:hypothetical protein